MTRTSVLEVIERKQVAGGEAADASQQICQSIRHVFATGVSVPTFWSNFSAGSFSCRWESR
jgi:hypothetical protein